jgi:uncharacterized membrane protein YphA (DoxX/SURF4 family)
MLHYSYMLNLIPIQFLALFAYFILRVIVGLIVYTLGTKLLRRSLTMRTDISHRPIWIRVLAFVLVTAGILCILGLFTQIAAAVIVIVGITQCLSPTHSLFQIVPHRIFWILLSGTGVSLFITGAGQFAIDLPI